MSEPTTAGEVMRRCLLTWNFHKDQIIPRCCLTGWEADLLIIRPSGWAEEVEIKVSASDFRAEWKKKAEKHEALMLGRRVIVRPGIDGVFKLGDEVVTDDPTLHKVEHKYWEQWYVRRPGLIRRFWFAMPKSLAEKLLPEVPEQYGVLAVGAYNEVLRPATNLKAARKLTDAERIHALHSAYYRFWQMQLREPVEAMAELAGQD